jgi:hypothetical protein
MAIKPEDIKIPTTARQKNRSARRNDVGNRGSKIKDMGTAKSIRDLANEMKQSTNLQVQQADRKMARSERMTALQIDSSRTIARARTAESDEIKNTAMAKAEASFKRRDNSLAAYTQIVADTVGIASALQEKRKDFEQGLQTQELQLESAKYLAEEMPKIYAGLDGTSESVANANKTAEEGLRKIFADARANSQFADDAAYWADLDASIVNTNLVNIATSVGTKNHNAQVYAAGKKAEEIYKEQISYVKNSGDMQGAISRLDDMNEVLKNGLLTEKQADDIKKAGHAAVVDAAIQHHYERGDLPAVRRILNDAQGTYEGEDPTLNAVVGEMKAQGVPVLRAMAIIGAESGLRAGAKNPKGSASGIYQQINDTFRENYKKVYGYDPIRYFPNGVNKNVGMARHFSIEKQAKVGAFGLAQHQNALKTMLKREFLTDSEAYSAHVLGPANAYKLLNFPDSVPITSIVSAKTARINPWTKKGGQVFTVGEVKAWMHNKMETNKAAVLKKGYVHFKKGFSQYIDTDKVASWSKTLATEEERQLTEAVKYAKKKAEVFSSHSGDTGDKADPVSFVMDRPDVIAATNEIDSLLTTADEQGNLIATPEEIAHAE